MESLLFLNLMVDFGSLSAAAVPISPQAPNIMSLLSAVDGPLFFVAPSDKREDGTVAK